MNRIGLTLCAAALAFAGTAGAQTGVVGTACKDDIQRYCPDISHIGGAVHLCLGEHLSQVSAACRAAMESAGAGNGRFGRGGQFQHPHYMGIRQVVATVAALGFTGMREIEFEGGHDELQASSPEGVAVVLYVDAVTWKILRSSTVND